MERPSYSTIFDNREKLKGRGNALTVGKNWYIKEILSAFDSFLAIEVVVEPFEYSCTLDEKAKLLVEEVMD